ncbi:MAG TPA: SMC-Scp complex subunit ScpB [Tepidisphaeraceae bacterium]|nr:SMC-Scp complex subunit ScpB [Tepidisphaeraceae bacterium]
MRTTKKPVHMRLVTDDEPELASEGDVPEVIDQTVPDEQPDGAVEEAVEENAEETSTDTELPPVNLASLEALLFSTHHPLTAGKLAELLDFDSTKPIRRAIKQLNETYESTGRSFRVELVAGGYQLLTLPEHGDLLKKMHQKDIDAKLTKAALETLAIIAYKQPILRADIEAIRGVQCGETIRSLMEKHLVKIAGRAEEPGRPILYGTTKRFLELFGLNSIKDLPVPESGKPLPQQNTPTA